MATIELLALDRTDWERVAVDPDLFAGRHLATLGAEPDLLRAIAKQNLVLFDRTGVIGQPGRPGLALGTRPRDEKMTLELTNDAHPGFLQQLRKRSQSTLTMTT